MIKEFAKMLVAVAGASVLMTGATIGAKKAVSKKQSKKQEVAETKDNNEVAEEPGTVEDDGEPAEEKAAVITPEPDPTVKVPKFSVIRE